MSIFSAFVKNIIAIVSNGIRDKITKLEEVFKSISEKCTILVKSQNR